MGYSSVSKAWLFYDPKTRQTRASRSAKFDERWTTTRQAAAKEGTGGNGSSGDSDDDGDDGPVSNFNENWLTRATTNNGQADVTPASQESPDPEMQLAWDSVPDDLGDDDDDLLTDCEEGQQE